MAVTRLGSWLEAQQPWGIPKRGAKSLDYEFVVSSRCRRTGMATYFGCSCSESRGGDVAAFALKHREEGLTQSLPEDDLSDLGGSSLLTPSSWS
jgi:hypothetical protein